MDDQSYDTDAAVDKIAQTIAMQREAISMLREKAEEAIESEDVYAMTTYLQTSIDIAEELLNQAAELKADLATRALKREREWSA
jgi:hypothetical protein